MPTSWIFTISEFCTFCNNGGLVLELCIKSGSNISDSGCNRRTFVLGIRLMTSLEITSGYVFVTVYLRVFMFVFFCTVFIVLWVLMIQIN